MPRIPSDVLCSAAVTAPQIVIVRNVRAIDPARGLDAVVDVILEQGRISRLGPGVAAGLCNVDNARIIEGKGRWLLPAFVDMHAHFREPGQEYKEDISTGLMAAAAGGFAHVCAMPNTKPVNDTRAVTEMMLYRAASITGPKLHPIGAITVGQLGRDLTEMGDLRDAGIVAVSDDGVCLQSSAVMRRALEYAKNFGLPVIQHAEDAELVAGGDMNEGVISARLGLRGRPRVAEDIIVARDILLAEWVGAHYHVAHVSSRGSARLIAEAKDRGIHVTAEVTPHHLLLTEEACLGYDTACKCNPPLREAEDVAAMVKALADGTIEAIATDHAPHSPMEKDCEFSVASPGLIGLETCFGLLLGLVNRGDVKLTRLIDALSTAPAKIVGIEPPTLREGALADLVLVDPEARYVISPSNIRSKSKNSPFMNRELVGKVLMTVASGNVVFDAIEEAK